MGSRLRITLAIAAVALATFLVATRLDRRGEDGYRRADNPVAVTESGSLTHPAPKVVQRTAEGVLPSTLPIEDLAHVPWVRGRIVLDAPLPPGETLAITVLGRFPKGHALSPRESEASAREAPMVAYARVSVDEALRFGAPRHRDAKEIKLVLESRFLCWADTFTNDLYLNRRGVPGKKEQIFHAHVGTHVTLRLDFDGIASMKQLDALIGAELAFECWDLRAVDSGPWRRIGTVEAGGLIHLPAMIPGTWELARFLTNSWTGAEPFEPKKSLAPFRVIGTPRFTLGHGSELEILLPLEELAALEGVVRDESGAPIAGAKVQLTLRCRDLREQIVECRSDQQGAFRCAGLSSSTTRGLVTADGFESKEWSLAEMHGLPNRRERVAITLRRAIERHIECRLPSGRVPSGVRITARRRHTTENSAARDIASVSTGLDGNAVFRSLPPVPLEFSGVARISPGAVRSKHDSVRAGRTVSSYSSESPGGGMPHESELWYLSGTSEPDGDENVVLACEAAPRLRGVVRWDEGTDVTALKVRLIQTSRPVKSLVPKQVLIDESHYFVDPITGRFGGPVPRGTHCLVAVGTIANGEGGTSQLASAPLNFTAGESVGELELRLALLQSISGHIVSSGGMTGTGARVTLDVKRRHRKTLVASTVAGDDGEFRFDSLLPGSYEIRAANEGFSGAPTKVELRAEGSLDGLEIPAAGPGGAIEIYLDAADSRSVSIQLIDANGRRIGQPSRWRDASTFYGVPAGLVTVEVIRTTTLAMEVVDSQVVEVVEGEVTFAWLLADHPTSTVRGRINTKYASEFGLFARLRRDSRVLATTRVAAEGSFALHLHAAGSATLEVGYNGPRSASWTARPLETGSQVVVDTRSVPLSGPPVTVGTIVFPEGSARLLVDADFKHRLPGDRPTARLLIAARGDQTEKSQRALHVDRQSVVHVPWLPDGDYRISCESEFFRMDPVDFVVGAAGADGNVVVKLIRTD